MEGDVIGDIFRSSHVVWDEEHKAWRGRVLDTYSAPCSYDEARTWNYEMMDVMLMYYRDKFFDVSNELMNRDKETKNKETT